MLMKLARAAAVLTIVALPFATVPGGSAAAQTKHEHKHDHEAMAKHGGTITEVGAYDVEVLIDGGKLVVYIYDEHGDDITKSASKGDAIFVVSGASKKVALEPAGGRLEGNLGFTTKTGDDLDAVLRLVVEGKTHTGKAEIHPK